MNDQDKIALHANSRRVRITRGFTRWLSMLVFGKILLNLNVTGLEGVPKNGPAIIVFNHMSNLDPIVVASIAIPRDMVPIGKQELMKNPIFALIVWAWGALLIRRGEADVSALKQAIAVVQSGLAFMMAPEGHRQRIGMTTPKEGPVMVAAKTHATLIPIGLSGTSTFMDAVKHLRRPPITVRVGKPFRIKEGVTRKQYTQAAREMMYQISALVNPEIRGEFADLSQTTTDTIEFV